jgi:hypothetical protein
MLGFLSLVLRFCVLRSSLDLANGEMIGSSWFSLSMQIEEKWRPLAVMQCRVAFMYKMGNFE